MGYAAKITSKGQITLPAGLREELDLTPGDSIVFFTDLDGSARFAVDRRRDRPVRAVARYDGPALDIAALDPRHASDAPPAPPAKHKTTAEVA